MKRPHLVHFIAIQNQERITLKASVNYKNMALENFKKSLLGRELVREFPHARHPIQSFRQLRSGQFQIKIIGLQEQKEVFNKVYETDEFGTLYVKISLHGERKDITALLVYEVGHRPGIEIYLGNYLPLKIPEPKKLIICDFDKTLVHTQYSTTKEVVKSLTSPLGDFPTISSSVDILKNYINDGYVPFILSASPHFYEDAMRDWLFANGIYSAGIFLKDYRRIFSLFENVLTPKDLKIQGLYKMNHLLDILLMTGIPDQLILMGDNFESDPIVYLGLVKILEKDMQPRSLWNLLNGHKAFFMNKRQQATFLNKLYQLHSLLAKAESGPKVKIYIRQKAKEKEVEVPPSLQSFLPLVEMYQAVLGHQEKNQ